MNNDSWPKEEIIRLAQSSGKPIEVTCAQAFLSSGWSAKLGSYFLDSQSVMRELDVIAEKAQQFQTGAVCRVRALVSCRGFAPERSPLTYSVSPDRVPGFSPRLLSNHRGMARSGVQGSAGLLPRVEAAAGTHLLQVAGLGSTRQIVAFDMLERHEKRPGPKKKPTEPVTDYRRASDGDKQLYTAIDSAVQAALYWTRSDGNQQSFFISLNVPVCVLSIPFWDVCIDGGTVTQPSVLRTSYQANLYPTNEGERPCVCLIWSLPNLPQLVQALDELFRWLTGEVYRPDFEVRGLTIPVTP